MLRRFGRVKQLPLKIAGRHREAVKGYRERKVRQGWVNRVPGVRVLYFGWYGPLLENGSYGGCKKTLDKWGLPTIGWDVAASRFSPVLLTIEEYQMLTTNLKGCMEWSLTPIVLSLIHI